MIDGMEKRVNPSFDTKVRAVKAVVEDHMPCGSVARMCGVHRITLQTWLRNFRKGKNYGDLERKRGSGPKHKIKNSVAVVGIVLKPATEFGYETNLWTSQRLIQVYQNQYGIKVSQATMWRTLRDWGLSYQKPEKKYLQANEGERQTWIKDEVPKIKKTVEENKAILYFEDESNIQLSPTVGKTWSPVGHTPELAVTSARGSFSAISAITKNGNLVFNIQEKRINSDDVISFLKQLLQFHSKRHLVVVMDNASVHVSAKVEDFIEHQRRLHVFNLPAYSPDMNPDEKVWNYLKHHALKGHQAVTKSDVMKLTTDKLNQIAHDSELVKALYFRCHVADLMN